MNTTEWNKLIAKFMGFEYYGWNNPEHRLIGSKQGYWGKKTVPVHHVKVSQNIKFNPLSYEVSWDELMPVVDKIESMGFSFSMSKNQTQVFDDSKEYPASFIIDADHRDTKILNTWDAVCCFIDMYNKSKDGKE